MDIVVLPQALLLFYGAVVLGSGMTLGVILGRHLKRQDSPPADDDDLRRRMRLLEQEVESTQNELADVAARHEFMHRLRERDPDRRPGGALKMAG